jgi:hypothetical protein
VQVRGKSASLLTIDVRRVMGCERTSGKGEWQIEKEQGKCSVLKLQRSD